LLVSNQGLVWLLARKYQGAHDIDDLVQEANLGLMQAVEKFDPRRNLRFGTYAAWWINAYLLRFMKVGSQLIKTGQDLEMHSLDNPMPGDEDATYLDYQESPDLPTDEQVRHTEVAAQVRNVIAKLAPSLRSISRKRPGLAQAVLDERLLEERTTLEDIARRFSISRERVRTVERAVMELFNRHIAHWHPELVP
jgi:RNA polymerase primary sigma factor